MPVDIGTETVTKRIDVLDHQRPRRLLGERLRRLLECPLCKGSVIVVAYRARTARFECEECGLRFSAHPDDVGRSRLRQLRDMPLEDRQALGEVWSAAVREACHVEGLSAFRAGDTPEERFELARAYGRVLAARGERLD